MQTGTVFSLCGLIIQYNSSYYLLINGFPCIIQPERLTELLLLHKGGKQFHDFADFKDWIEN